jgi:heterodisulfide reductase subunit B
MQLEGKKRLWAEYQKNVPDDHFFYVRSCIRQTFFPGSEQAFLKIMRNDLGKDIYEDPRHTTCTGIGYHGDVVPFETIQAVVARQFSLATEAGYKNIAISCVTSFGIYTEILETWKHFPETLALARENLYKATGRVFDIPESISHASDIIYRFKEEIARKAKYNLVDINTGKPLKVVEHIGCHYAKMFPTHGIGGAEFPHVLVGMVESWGGEVIDYPERRHCCGFGFRQYLVQANRGYSVSSSRKKFESMEPYQPDMIVTNCPGCAMFLDRWQFVIREIDGATYGKNGQGIPSLTFEEMAGLVMGYDPWELGVQYHNVQALSLLNRMGIKVDPAERFLAKDGTQLPEPANLLNS